MNGHLVELGAGASVSPAAVVGISPVWVDAETRDPERERVGLPPLAALTDVFLAGGSVMRIPVAAEEVGRRLAAYGIEVHAAPEREADAVAGQSRDYEPESSLYPDGVEDVPRPRPHSGCICPPGWRMVECAVHGMAAKAVQERIARLNGCTCDPVDPSGCDFAPDCPLHAR